MSETSMRALPLAALQLSKAPAQVERRAHFDKAKLTELADSIKAHGLVQPILVRPFKSEKPEFRGGDFEVVAGERRVLAARQAGLEEIAATVRELTDEQVYELQLIENLQRQDLHELAEAEGYEALAKLGHTVDDMAAKVGKSKATVYARMKLLALDPASRQAMYRGELSASVALLIARIPVASVQREALIAVTKPKHGPHEPLSYRDAREQIERQFMLRLSDAPFPTGDAELLPKAGTCAACPKRTGNQPELFGDVKGADVCTDPICFKLKREAWAKVQIETAKADGRKVLTGTQAKQVAPYGADSTLQGGYVNLNQRCWEDPKNRTYRQLVGRAVKPELLLDKDGDVHDVVQKSAIAKILKEKGAVRQAARGPSYEADKAHREQRARERALEAPVLQAVFARPPKELSRADLERLVMTSLGYDGEEVYDYLGWEKPKGKDWRRYEKDTAEKIKKLTVPQLNALILIGDALSNGLADKPKAIAALAKRFKVDTSKLRKDLAAAAKAKKLAKHK